MRPAGLVVAGIVAAWLSVPAWAQHHGHHGGHLGGHIHFGGHHGGVHVDIGGHHGVGHIDFGHGLHHVGHHFDFLDHHDFVLHDIHHYDHHGVAVFLYGGGYYPYVAYPYVAYPYGLYYPYPVYSSATYVNPRRVQTTARPPAQRRSADENAPEVLGRRFLEQAKQAFRGGNYRQAVRMASHAAVELPRSPEVHHTLMLAMMALKDYRGASAAAIAALSHGQPWRWDDIRRLYGPKVADYTKHLRALEEHVRKNERDVPARFLLAYQYLMLDYPREATAQLERLLRVAPDHAFAAGLRNWLKDGRPKGEAWNPTKWVPRPQPAAQPTSPGPKPAPLPPPQTQRQ